VGVYCPQKFCETPPEGAYRGVVEAQRFTVACLAVNSVEMRGWKKPAVFLDGCIAVLQTSVLGVLGVSRQRGLKIAKPSGSHRTDVIAVAMTRFFSR
jgi:hypothetical protein